MLVTLLALGSAPASFLGRRFDAAARVAMAPVLGLCVGTCVFTTLIWFAAARNTYWLLPILALVSIGIALQRGLASIPMDRGEEAQRSRMMALAQRLRPIDAVALVVVCIVVATPLSYTLHERHSVGPVGYEVWDAVDYAAEPDAMDQDSIRQATDASSKAAFNEIASDASSRSLHLGAASSNFAKLFWTFYASGEQNLDAGPLSANLNELLSLHGTDTQSPFLIIFLVAGALGAFAAMRYAAPKPSWAAPLAGVLFAGPFFLQLLADGSQAATCGLAVILPILAVGVDVLRGTRWNSLVVLALLASGLMALYPLFVPAIALSGAVLLANTVGIGWWRGRLNKRRMLAAAGGLGLVISLSVLFNLVSFLRDVRYWHHVLEGTYYLSSLPQYHLPYSVLPGWLLQTREFYFLTELGSTSAKEVLIGVILPALFIAVIFAGLKRNRASLALLPPVVIYGAIAAYTSASHHCSYCTDRALLPIAPLSIGLLVLGVAALATAPGAWLRFAGIAVAAVALVVVGARTRQERMRFADDAYLLDSGNRALLAHLPAHSGAVDIEGYGEDPGRAPGELPLVYYLTSEHNHGAVSVPTEYEDYSSLAYLGAPSPSNPEFSPNYRYVLTRLEGVQTARRIVARTGSLALEKRTSPLDVTLVSGVAVPLQRLDADGLAWVEGPLHMLLVGGAQKPAWISLDFKAIVPVTVPSQPGVLAHTGANGVVTACVRVTGTAPVRRGTITLSFSPHPGIVPAEPFAVEEPPQGVQLVAMRAVTHCVL